MLEGVDMADVVGVADLVSAVGTVDVADAVSAADMVRVVDVESWLHWVLRVRCFITLLPGFYPFLYIKEHH